MANTNSSLRIAKRIVVGVVLLTVIAIGGFFSLGAFSPKTKITKLRHTVERGNLIVSVNEEGSISSGNNEEIKCEVQGGSTILWIIENGTLVEVGDELVKMDTSSIEDSISQQTISYENARATVVQSQSAVDDAKITIEEFEEAIYPTDIQTAQRNVVSAKTILESARDTYKHTQSLATKGFVTSQQVESDYNALKDAELFLEIQQSTLVGLEKFTKRKRLQELRSTLKAAEARLASNEANLKLEETRLNRAKKQLANCIILSKKSGMVLYPRAADWKEAPDIEEGARVRERQQLLVIPDMENMIVKVGIHESKIEMLGEGAPAEIKLMGRKYNGAVSSVASIAQPAGWWNGNAVKYATEIKLESNEGLRPGMNAEVEIFLARHTDVIIAPVACVIELADGFFCFVDHGPNKPEKRNVTLGDSNDNFVVIKEGLEEGETIFLNIRDMVDDSELKKMNLETHKESVSEQANKLEANKSAADNKKDADNEKLKPKPSADDSSAAKIIEKADKDGDGALSKEEADSEIRSHFTAIDADGNKKIDATELDVAIQAKAAAEKNK